MTDRFKAELHPLVICTSQIRLNKTESTKVKDLINMLGGKLEEKWNKTCTHLLMNKLQVTTK
eukprot:Pgem_evm1s8861